VTPQCFAMFQQQFDLDSIKVYLLPHLYVTRLDGFTSSEAEQPPITASQLFNSHLKAFSILFRERIWFGNLTTSDTCPIRSGHLFFLKVFVTSRVTCPQMFICLFTIANILIFSLDLEHSLSSFVPYKNIILNITMLQFTK